jgi:GTPase
MAFATVAIIGRPNVGKSSLLNALAGEMISIVEPTAGVTRDRVSTFIERNGHYIELIDTGGYGIVDSDALESHVTEQIEKAIDSANLILFMVDIRDGITPLDQTIAKLLREKKGLKVIGVANKADSAKMFSAAGEFKKLGFGEFLCISAVNNLNKNTLLDMIFDELSHLEGEKPKTPAMKIAIVGKRNAGKSTLVNAMSGQERMIVSEVAGTTRDAVDVRFEKDGQTIVVIDTAGVRKKSKMSDSIEFYSYVRATKSIARADVVMLLVDATTPVSQVDKKLAHFISEEYKSCILVINKWDLALQAGSATDDYEDYLTKVLPELRSVPIAFTTAKESKNIQSLLDLAGEIYKQTTTWLPTAKLNKAFEELKEQRISASKTTKGRPRIYYATQIAVNPITILMFVNKPEIFEENYMRYLRNRLREMLPISEVPIRLLTRPHSSRNQKENES